jgi:toxin FitB
MIVLDTNIISELVKPEPMSSVVAWFQNLPSGEAFITAITRAEALAGIYSMQPSLRREMLEAATRRLIDEEFGARTLMFDAWAAHHCAEIIAIRKQLGRTVGKPDAMIAGTARSYGATMATRNVRDFDSCGLDIINPFDDIRVPLQGVRESSASYDCNGFDFSPGHIRVMPKPRSRPDGDMPGSAAHLLAAIRSDFAEVGWMELDLPPRC